MKRWGRLITVAALVGGIAPVVAGGPIHATSGPGHGNIQLELAYVDPPDCGVGFSVSGSLSGVFLIGAQPVAGTLDIAGSGTHDNVGCQLFFDVTMTGEDLQGHDVACTALGTFIQFTPAPLQMRGTCSVDGGPAEAFEGRAEGHTADETSYVGQFTQAPSL